MNDTNRTGISRTSVLCFVLFLLNILQSVVLITYFGPEIQGMIKSEIHSDISDVTYVTSATIRSENYLKPHVVLGTVKALNHTDLIKPTQNLMIVKEIHCSPGQEVKKGDSIVTLSCAELEYEYQSKKIECEYHKARLKKLDDAGTPKKDQNYAEAEFAARKSQSSFDLTQRMIDDLTLKAPFDGEVGMINVCKGATIYRHDTIITSITDSKNLSVHFDVSINLAKYLGPAKVVKVTPLNDNNKNTVEYEGLIIGITTTVNNSNGMIPVRARIKNDSITGIFQSNDQLAVNVIFQTYEIDSVFRIPYTAMFREDNTNNICKIIFKEGIPYSKLVCIELIDHVGDDIIVTSTELKDKDRIVIDNAPNCTGAKLYIKSK